MNPLSNLSVPSSPSIVFFSPRPPPLSPKMLSSFHPLMALSQLIGEPAAHSSLKALTASQLGASSFQPKHTHTYTQSAT